MERRSSPFKIDFSDETEELRNEIYYLEKFVNRSGELTSLARDLFIDFTMFSENSDISTRKSFRGRKGAKEYLDEYSKVRYEILKPRIDSFFGSDVMSCLIEQYRDAIAVKRQVGLVVES